MRIRPENRNWLFGLMCAIGVVGAAAALAQRDGGPATPTARDARELSSVFREVAHSAIPSIVSIETVGKTVEVSQDGDLPFDEDSPFGDMFRSNPELRDFFRQFRERPRRFPPRRGMGSGFIIDESGIVMTNNHVVRDVERVTIRLHDGREFIASDIKTDPRSDVAVIRFDAPNDLQAIRLGDSDEMQIGDWVLAVGNPFGLDMTVTQGIISAKSRSPQIATREDFLQTDAAINPGNSGGPLLNLNGEVIGINTAISTRSGGYDGVGFAIPVNMAKWVADQLIDKGEVQRAYIGVAMQPVDNAMARKFDVPVGTVIITQVMPGTPAAEAGLRIEDIILKLNGVKVRGTLHLQGLVEQLKVGETYEMRVLREGKEVTVPITMQAMPEQFASRATTRPLVPDQDPTAEKYDELGLQIRELTPQIAEQLGLEEDAAGVVISGVDRNSPAGFARLRAGLVIERVDNQPVSSPEEFRKAIENASLKEGISLLVRSNAGTRLVVIQAD